MSTTSAQSPRAILVLGMHRSGTSAVTRVLNLLGADLGARLLPPVANNNVRGFWENAAIFEIHERLLATIGRSWCDVRGLPDGWLESDAASGAQAEIRQILQEEFAASPLWAVKDPRLCWLAPLWLRTLAECGIEPAILFVVRHPLEVAASLHARDALSRERACLLWAHHLLAAELATRGCVRAMVTYDQILQDWAGTMARVSHTLGIKWYRSPEEVQPDVDAFLDAGERHHRATTAPNDAAGDPAGASLSFVADLFHRCVRLSEDRGTWADLQNLTDEFWRVSAIYGTLIDEFVSYTHSAERRTQHLEAIMASAFPELDANRRQFEEASAKLVAASAEREMAMRSELAASAEREIAVRSELTERLLSVDQGLETTARLLAEQSKAIAALEQQLASMPRGSVLTRLRDWLSRSDPLRHR